MIDLEQAIARGDIVDFRQIIKGLSNVKLIILSGRVGKQPALHDAIWNEIRNRNQISVLKTETAVNDEYLSSYPSED